MVRDGLYGLRIAAPQAGGGPQPAGRGSAERVEALAVLRGGRLLGSDPNGGVFTGHYRYDASCGEAVVTLRLAVPPNGVLLTGLEVGPEGMMLDLSGRFAPPQPLSSGTVVVAGIPVSVELEFVGPLVS